MFLLPGSLRALEFFSFFDESVCYLGVEYVDGLHLKLVDNSGSVFAEVMEHFHDVLVLHYVFHCSMEIDLVKINYVNFRPHTDLDQCQRFAFADSFTINP